MKKCCYFIGTPLQRTAVSAHFQALARELVRRGHEAVLVAPPDKRESDTGNNQVHMETWPSTRPTRLADAAFLWRLIGRHRPDCLIANFGAVNWMSVVGWLKRVPCRIAWYHTLSTQIDRDRRGFPNKARYLRLRKKFIYQRATHIAANSVAASEDVCRTFDIPNEKCKVWQNSLADPADWLNLKGSENREDLVVCAGRFDRSKGQDVLVEALALCADRLHTTRIEFLGTGPMLDHVRGRVQHLKLIDRCLFRGSVPHDEVMKRMSSARLTVVPSRSEAFGLVNIESMAVGTPVIASGVDGIKEIVRDGVDGFLVPPDDASALAERLVALLQNAALRQTLGDNARKRFLDVYEQSRVVTSQADWLDKITRPRTDSMYSKSPQSNSES